MSNNVILLGAGASFDAGIPLLGNFVDRMLEMAQTGRSPRGPISQDDQEILKSAMKIRDKLEGYHARVAIDQYNLEQILSVLSFESYAGGRGKAKDLDIFSRAIARTIELTCNVLHDGRLDMIQEVGDGNYMSFWSSLFELYKNRMEDMPTILSFNYDLVLERSLFQLVIGHKHNQLWEGSKCGGIIIDYQNENCGNSKYFLKSARWSGRNFESHYGYTLQPYEGEVCDIPENFVRIPILKLHGSLNFPTKRSQDPWSPVVAVPNAKIIPPVFNKTDAAFASPIWKYGLSSLRNCKNLIICGYSLPTTDTYMQYFLKAALGPNLNLNKIFVFDPALYQNGEAGKSLRKRYTECFSRQLESRINFDPSNNPQSARGGTFKDLVIQLKKSPDNLLFGLLPKTESGNPSQFESVESVRRKNPKRFSGL
jgi:hypothetical protein